MREHVRREAAQYAEAVWWLVPVAFAAAALAAVALSTRDFDDAAPAAVQHAAVTLPKAPPVPARPAPATPASVRAPQQDEIVIELVEHVQAF
jgi:hypothetical protein